MSFFRVRTFRLVTSCVSAFLLIASGAKAQVAGAPGEENECKFFKVEIGQSAEIKPHEELKVEDLEGFHYFLKGDAGLREDFRIPEDIRESCAAVIPVFQQAASQAAVGATASAAAAAGVAPATLAAGSIAGSLGVAAGVAGIAVVGVAVGAVAATSGGSTTSTVSTINAPTIGPE